MSGDLSFLYENIIKSFPTAIALVDGNGVIRLVNSEIESVFGYSEEELVGSHFEMLITEDLRIKHVEHVNGFNSDPAARIMGKGREVNGLCKDGSRVPIEVGLRPIDTENGLFVLCVIIDISDRLERDKKLHELEQTKARFLANITHEFLTPLTLITGPVDEIIKNAADSGILQNASIVQKNAKILQGLINQLLDISDLSFRRKNLKIWNGNTRILIEKVSLAYSDVVRNKSIILEINSRGNCNDCFFDSNIMEMIVSNLFNIATGITPVSGTVKVEYYIDAGIVGSEMLRLLFVFSGELLSGEKLERIVRNELFFETDADIHISRDIVHTGELVAVHRGEMEISSDEKRQIRMEVSVPVNKQAYQADEVFENLSLEQVDEPADHKIESDSEITDDQGEVNEEEKKKVVLLIEDNRDMLRYISFLLKSEFRVHVARDGIEGTEKALEIIPDLIISDIMMPGKDGLQVCNDLKSDIRTIHIPVILLTAKSAIEYKLEGLEKGADDYLSKPFHKEELFVRVKNLIKSREVLRSHFKEMVVIKPSEITTNSMDEQFLSKIMSLIENNFENSNFGVDELAREMLISQSQLYRKLQALTGYSISSFIQTVRLKRAAEMIQKQTGSISEIAFSVGFTSPAYFAKCFKSHFGCTPRQFSENNR